MGQSIDHLKKPIAKELDLFETSFRQSMASKVALLDTIMNYIVKRKGKQIRPMFVLYSAALFGEINERSYRGASLVELLHTATLVHDDVVDESHMRRGFFSINALWKNKIAVLVGDYLLSKGLLLSVENEDFDLLKILSTSVREMSEGELLQLEKARNLSATKEIYFEIIRKKTATLVASCCEIGTATTNPDKEAQQKMRLFGEYIGLAFQIRDDLFDFEDSKSGKPSGNDLKEKKLTLPLLIAFENSTPSEIKRIKKAINKGEKHKNLMKEVMDFLRNKDAITKTKDVMNDYYSRAIEILLEVAPDSEYRAKLLELVKFVIVRDK
ncbi:MAG: polyprenyl synthetase family protein [Bacteroidia bacterium]|nr:polyprenyl synthetase family protein [Bacteroidia bacterium]